MEFWKFELFTLLNAFVFFGNFVARVFPVFFGCSRTHAVSPSDFTYSLLSALLIRLDLKFMQTFPFLRKELQKYLMFVSLKSFTMERGRNEKEQKMKSFS